MSMCNSLLKDWLWVLVTWIFTPDNGTKTEKFRLYHQGYALITVDTYLEHGADLTATNNEGHTALSLAVGVGNKNGESLIEKKIWQWLR